MRQSSLSFQRIAYFLVIATILTYVLVVGKGFLVPLVYAMLLAFMLKPVCDGVENIIPKRGLAIIVAMILIVLPLIGIVTLFSLQLRNVFEDFQPIVDGLLSAVQRIIDWANVTFDANIRDASTWISDNLMGALAAPFSILADSLSSSSLLLANVILTVIYTFFFLLYRTAIKNFVLGQFDWRSRKKASEVLYDVQHVVQRYLYGLFLVIIILAILNSLGLYLIGIDYAFFWGVLAACLAIIPYIGTTLGGTLPFLYAFATSESLLTPISVIILYVTIQSVEGNYITPKIVGGSVHLNPLAAIISLILGGILWGVSGLILALPIVAVLKITMDNIDSLRPVGLLLSDDLYKEQDEFLHKYDHPRFRVTSLFRRDQNEH